LKKKSKILNRGGRKTKMTILNLKKMWTMTKSPKRRKPNPDAILARETKTPSREKRRKKNYSKKCRTEKRILTPNPQRMNKKRKRRKINRSRSRKRRRTMKAIY